MNKPYIFRVMAVIDGDRSGVLLERYKKSESRPFWGYFWLDEPQGLAPTESIRQKCGENCRQIEVATNYKDKPKIWARFYNQERIFRDLLAYTKYIANNKEALSKCTLEQDYSDKDKGYAEVLQLFFADESSCFRKFLISLNIYTKCVIRKSHGKDFLEGMAEKFEIRNLFNLFPEENFKCLSTVNEIMQTEKAPKPKWFREGGPVISDFEKEKVYIRDEVDTLKVQIRDKSFYILQGDSSTGKTIIVKTLMWKLHDGNVNNVYYFDIDTYRDFNRSELVDDIRSVKGIFIIENIHLEVQKAQWIYRQFINDRDRHILFVSRPGFEKFQNNTLPDLRDIDRMSIGPFGDVEKVIKKYCDDPEVPSVVWDRRQDIINNFTGDLWLLACSLKGCTTLMGTGTGSLQWIEVEVLKKLQSLEHCKDSYSDQYPGIIVALSALYKSELLTAECFLLKLGFTKAAINGLLERHEIRKQIENDDVYYGLIHSSLSTVYWEYGRQYITMKSLRYYKEYIYFYLTSKTPNALRVMLSTNLHYKKLSSDNNTSQRDMKIILENEQFISAIYLWLRSAHKNQVTSEILNIIKLKIEDKDNFQSMGDCLREVNRLDSKKAIELWNILNLRLIAMKLLSLNTARYCIARLFDVNMDWGIKLVECVDYKKLILSLSQELNVESPSINNISHLSSYLNYLALIRPIIHQDMLKLIDLNKLGYVLSKQEDLSFIIRFIDEWGPVREYLSASLNMSDILNVLEKSSKLKVLTFVSRICEFNNIAGHQLCKKIGFSMLSDIINTTSLEYHGMFFKLKKANYKLWPELCSVIDKRLKHLEHYVMTNEDISLQF